MPSATFRGTPAQLKALLANLPAVLAGRVADPTGEVRGLLLRLGMTALSLVKEAYVAKARGGTDAAGQSWQPLQPATIAYGRTHPGLAKKRSAAAKKGRVSRPLLTEAQDALWRRTYAQCLARFQREGGSDAGSHAAACAWVAVKAKGGQTILGKYGQAKVEILRDTGVLLNSLSPGSGSPQQVCQAGLGEITVGTKVPYAAAHHRGVPGKLPQRRLWPEVGQWPASWWQALAKSLADGLTRVLERMVQP